MSMFDFDTALARVAERLRPNSKQRRPRSDRGKPRMTSAVLAKLTALTAENEQPRMTAVLRELTVFCREHGEKVPSRAAVYNTLETLPTGSYRVASLPAEVQQALYNLTAESTVPGHQLAFYCLNYGNARALSFAAALPWLALHQAARQRGWRTKSRGLVTAIIKARRAR